MRLGVGTVFAVCTFALGACGGGPISTDGGSGETGEGTDDTGGPDGLACIDENGLVPGVLRLEPAPARAWLIDGGAEIELPLEGDDEAVSMVGATAGDLIAVARVDIGPYGRVSVVQVFSRSSAELLWTREVDGVTVSQLWVGEDGLIAGALYTPFPGFNTGFVMSNDEMLELTSHEPLAAPTLGHVAVAELGPSGGQRQFGWIEFASNSFRLATPEPGLRAAVAEDGHTIEYFELVDGVFSLVRARPDETESIVLPLGPDFFFDEDALFVRARNEGYRVVQYSPDATLIVDVLVDIEAGEAMLVNPEPPQGWSYFDCYDRRLTVDGDGRVIYELRNDANARPWAYDVETDEWTPLGRGLTLVDDMNVTALSPEWFLVEGTPEENDYYCPATIEWTEAPEDALIGDSTQLVRRDPAIELVLPAATEQVLIDRQQRCGAWLSDTGWKVRPLDGSEMVLDIEPGAGMWLWLD